MLDLVRYEPYRTVPVSWEEACLGGLLGWRETAPLALPCVDWWSDARNRREATMVVNRMLVRVGQGRGWIAVF